MKRLLSRLPDLPGVLAVACAALLFLMLLVDVDDPLPPTAAVARP